MTVESRYDWGAAGRQGPCRAGGTGPAADVEDG